MTVLSWLKEIRQQWMGLRDFEHTPLAKIHGWAPLPAGAPLFEGILNVQDPSWDLELRAQGGDWSHRQFRIINQPSYPLALDVYGGEKVIAKLVYDRRRFDEGSMLRMLGHFQTLLEAMVNNPEQELETLPLLTRAESELLDDWNQTEAELP